MKLLVDFILIAGIVVIAIILFSLTKSKTKELPQRIMIVVFISLLIVAANSYAYLQKIKWLLFTTHAFEDSIELFLGPLFFIYVKSLYERNEGLIKRNSIHFIPFAIAFIFISIPLTAYLITRSYFNDYVHFIDENMQWFLNAQGLFMLIYMIWAFLLLRKYEKASKENYSNAKVHELSWVKYVIIGGMGIILLDVITTVYEVFIEELDWNTGYLTVVAMVIWTFFLAYNGFSQSRILLPDFIINDITKTGTKELPIEKSTPTIVVKEKEAVEMKSRLLEILKKDRPYLDEDLTLGALAKMVQTTDKKLSNLLNTYLEISFYDLINNYRVEEVKSKLQNPQFESYTLLAIAFESGFKSKTSFNRIFKKVTTLSPSQYKKRFTTDSRIKNG